MIAKTLIIIGIIFLLLGSVLYFYPGIFRWIGHLPGDIHVEGSSGSFHFPLATSLLASVLFSLILWLIRR